MPEYKVIETQKYKIMVAVIIGQFVTLLFSFLFIGSVQREALDLKLDNVELQEKYDRLVKDTKGCMTETCLREIK